MQADLNDGSVLRRALSFCLPLALGMAFHASFNLIDLAIVGLLGEEAVAAVHFGGTINFFPMILGNGISVGTVSLLSRSLGRGDRKGAERTANLVLYLMMGLSVVLGLGFYLFAESCCHALSARGTVLVEGARYLEVLSLGTLSMFLVMHVTGVLRAIGNAFWPVAILISSNLLNIGLDYLFIFGFEPLGLPAYGPTGAAIATVIARFFGGFLGIFLLFRRSSPLRPGFALPDGVRRELRSLLRLGVPQSIQILVRASLVLVATYVGGNLAGPAGAAALGIGTRLDTFILFAALGWASGATAMVGRAAGARDLLRCRHVAEMVSSLAGVMAFGFSVLYFTSGEWLLRLFVSEPSADLVRETVLYLRFMALAHPCATITLVLAGAMNGGGRSVLPMALDALVLLGLTQAGLFLWWQLGHPGGTRAAWALMAIGQGLLLLAYAVVHLRLRGAPVALTGPGEPC